MFKYVSSIKFNGFRIFESGEIKLGKMITAIAGKNAVGKSTILGMLGNSVQLEKTNDLTKRQFKTDFSDIFKGSSKFDKSGSDKFSVYFSNKENDEYIDYRDFRIAWQQNETRFRVIPKKELKNDKVTEAKVKHPVIYLGLSRLYPIGEAKDEDIQAKESTFQNEDEKQWFWENYKKILTLIGKHDFENLKSVNYSKASKNGTGINTSSYDYLTNSAGQDNLGQILLTVLAFARLKEMLREEYEGGLVLIDEIDATLHPLAQLKLLDFMSEQARKLNLQFVFTTHSLSLLETISEKTLNNNLDKNNNIEIAYLTTDNESLEIMMSPSYSIIESDMLLKMEIHSRRKLEVIVEDDEAAWLLEKLLAKYLDHIKIKSAQMGCDYLMSMAKLSHKHFSKVLFMLDGDYQKQFPRGFHFMLLPGQDNNFNPEKLLYNFIIELPGDHEFFKPTATGAPTKNYYVQNPPTIFDGEKLRDKEKKWFNDHKAVFNDYDLVDYWILYNSEEYDKFIAEFVKCFNNLADILKIPKISQR
ncbi:AAA family ATPase [Isachenkonia alkalipeptolytica]|uniref:ATP-binding protein n=1 Tax=Isachenkonia alkalipeptolytica TaxID=2565777 RepID=A0AA43XKP3_9CLOT|nr:AAA family ATPase [Isachenkonia alkalipeptolytica]NBG88126.1 ATP-binding protein [Isachenkonia alkalipeptolytica]